MKLESSPIQLGENKTIKTADQLKKALRLMGRTLSALPLTNLDKPMGPRSSWPDYKQKNIMVTSEYRRVNKPRASAKDISEAQYWLSILAKLDTSSRRIVMARAMSITWRRLEEMDGRSHTTLRKIEQAALQKILAQIQS